MQFPEIETITTARLILRKLTLSDVRDYYDRIGSSAAVTK